MANDEQSKNEELTGDAGRKFVEGSDGPLNDEEQTTKDRSYTWSSERETQVKQDDQSTHAPDVDTEKVDLLPGTGGPDDNGIVDVEPGEIHIPRSDAPGSRPV